MERIRMYMMISLIFQLMKLFSLGCLIFIAVWIFSYDEFSEGILEGFPMLCIPFKHAIENKKISAVLLPLMINIVLWLPKRKSYSLLYGIFTVEKWKSLLIAIQSGTYYFLISMSYPNNAGQYFMGLILSGGYFILLYYCTKVMNSKNFLIYYKIEECSLDIKRKILGTCLVYFLVLALYILEHNEQRFYSPMPLEATMSYDAGDGRVTDVSMDGKSFISMYDKEELSSETSAEKIPIRIPKGKIKIRDFETGETIKMIEQEGIVYGQFGINDDQIIAQKIDYEKSNGWLIIYNKFGEIKREFPRKNNLCSRIDQISYSDNKKYFATINTYVGIWDYDNGILLKEYNDLNYKKNLLWLDNNHYIIIQQKSNDFSDEDKWKVEVGYVTETGYIQITRKNNLEKLFNAIVEGAYAINIYLDVIGDGKKVVMIIRGIPLNGIMYRKSVAMILDVVTEQVEFCLDSTYTISQMKIFPELKRAVTCEELKYDELKGGKTRVTYWNMDNKKREQVIIVGGMQGGSDPRYSKIIESGKKIIEFGSYIKVYNIENVGGCYGEHKGVSFLE